MSLEASTTLDLDAYFERISYTGDVTPTYRVLEALHHAHATAVPFENLALWLGEPVRLDLESLQAKLVAARRGGYCFEQNTLFAAVLRHLGFEVTTLAARVRLRSTQVNPRTHMVLKVEVEGQPWLVDVGFGGGGLLHPIRLAAGEESRQFAWTYRLVAEPGALALQCQYQAAWQDFYGFTLEPNFPVDYELANYFIATHPNSPFVRNLIVQRPSERVRIALLNSELITTRPDSETRRIVSGDVELLEILKAGFGLEFPAGTQFRSPSGATWQQPAPW